MVRVLVVHLVGLLSFAGLLGAVGCASPARIEEAAMIHEQRAVQCEAVGNYECARDEREAAAKQHRKAAKRAGRL